MVRTIETRFDPESLPQWVRQHAAVVELCKRSEGFAHKVRNAKTEHWRRYLVSMAERCIENMENVQREA